MSWTLRRVGDLALLLNGFPFDSAHFADSGEVPLVRIRDLTGDDFQTYVPREVVPEAALIQNGDVVIGMDGDFNVTLWSRGSAALNQRLCLLRDTGAADLRFLAYALPAHLKKINDLTYATTVKHLSSGQVKAIRLPAPPIREQRAIADYLDRETAQIDTLIEEQRRLIALVRERRETLVSATLKNFPPVRLRRLVDLERPMSYGILQCGPPVTDGVPYVGPSDLPGEGRPPLVDDLRRTSIEIASEYQRSVLTEGDVLVSIGPAYGRIGIVPAALAGGNITQDVVRVAPTSAVVPEYLIWALRSRGAKAYWELEIQGATFRRLNLGTLARTPIPLPDPSTQVRIARELEAATARMDQLLDAATRLIELSTERRSALITAAVTGQIDMEAAS